MTPGLRRMSAALAAPLLVLTAATGFAGSAEDAVISLIDAMRAAKRLNEPAFAKLAQCRFAGAGDASNRYFRILRGACDHPLVRETELRIPTAASSARDGLALVELRPGPCVDLKAATRRYGEGEPQFPSPTAPADAPMYLRYIGAEQRMSLAFQRDAPFCLVRVVIDRTAR